jgi:hypothetical protein
MADARERLACAEPLEHVGAREIRAHELERDLRSSCDHAAHDAHAAGTEAFEKGTERSSRRPSARAAGGSVSSFAPARSAFWASSWCTHARVEACLEALTSAVDAPPISFVIALSSGHVMHATPTACDRDVELADDTEHVMACDRSRARGEPRRADAASCSAPSRSAAPVARRMPSELAS